MLCTASGIMQMVLHSIIAKFQLVKRGFSKNIQALYLTIPFDPVGDTSMLMKIS